MSVPLVRKGQIMLSPKHLVFSLVLIAAVSAGALAGAEDKHVLSFKYKDGEKSSYDLALRLDMAVSARQPSQKQESSSSTSINVAMDVVERVQEGGNPSLTVTFHDLSAEQKLSGPAGELEVSISGRDVTVRRGGTSIIDTKKGEGTQLASSILRELGFLGAEGTISLGPDGRVNAISGSKELEQFLAPETGFSLFVLETPPAPVAVGETWVSSERGISRLRGLDLSMNPLLVKTRFTLQGFEERNGRRLARIALKSDFSQKDLSASAISDAIGNQPVTITSLERSATGIIYFDPERGKLIESELEVKLSVRMEMSFDSAGGSGDKEKVETTITGTAKSTAKLRG